MRLVQNSGSDRVVDLLLPHLVPGSGLSCVTPSFSLHAFAELREALGGLGPVQLVLPADDSQLELLGGEGDRAQRNRLQARWLAKQCAQWLAQKAEVRRAHGRVPQGAAVLTGLDNEPTQVVLGSFALSSEGLGLAPGNPLNLIQASESPEEARTLVRWFDQQWNALQHQPDGRQSLINDLKGMAAHRAPFEVYALILHHLLGSRDETLDEDRIVKAATGIRNTVIWKKLFKFQRDGVVGAIDKLARFGGCIIADSVGL